MAYCNVSVMVLVVIGIIVMVIIKLLIMYLDYREYKSFQKEVNEANFSKNSNPIYHAPTVTYDNVAYSVTMVTTCCAKNLVI